MNRLLATGATLALATATPLAAQQVYDLDTITVTADLSDATDTAQSGATVEVTTRDDLEKAGDNSVATYLSRQPGLSMVMTGGPGGTADIRIRGLHQRYTSVLIDGINVLDLSATNPAYNFGTLTTGGIGRIEVLKGSQSAQYGSAAVGGVVSINSRRATEEGTHVYLEGEVGSYDSFDANATVTSKGDRHNFAVTLSRLEFGGFSAADEEDGNTEEDSLSTIRLSFNGEYALTEALTIGLSGFSEKSDYDIDGGFPLGDTDETIENTSNGLRLFARYEGASVTHEFSATSFDFNRETSSGSTYEGERRTLAYLGQATLSPTTRLNFGFDYSDESFASFAFGTAAEGDVTNTGVFAELNWSPTAQLDVVAAIRHDEHEEFGGYTTGRVALAYRPQEDLILRGSLATGFRAPSLFELYAPGTGNPDLTPETSFSAELGIEKRLGGEDFIKATLFYTEVEDRITFGPTYPSPNIQAEGTSIAKGIELSGQKALSDRVSLFGNYTYTESEGEDGARVLRVPRHNLVLGVDADIAPRWVARAELQHVSDMLDVGPVEMDAYTIVNTMVTYQINDSAEAYFRIENIGDVEYQTVNGYGQSDRAFYVGLRARF
ncbi:TonB-dependent siderophore receptor [Oceanicola sp. 502str15]|uniref:TonB-dependent receptor plug domain-containing protein n=1 Tax=Oceanicola sp. 502str15 TaxID=2696061 RepID=UPI0020944A20|nr:TonB-dependent receptor [Oceanicola sp. 502str15]MCO6383917.1 TonB-dependent receptor [Oceanicola sp. 502str15]